MHPLSPDLREALENTLMPVVLPKGHYLAQAYSPAHNAYFLQTGFAVAFRYRRNKRVVTYFWQSGEIILSPKSFCKQLATDEIIQLTTDSELFSLSYPAFQLLSARFPVVNYLARDIAADYHSRSVERIVDLHTTDTWERYLKLLNSYPGIERFVAQDVIASYLNITPPSLSRLKSAHYKR